MAINAGLDMNMSDQTYINNLEQLVANGKVKEETINEAVRRILRVKFELGLFENPYVEYVPVDEDYHMSVARKIAGEPLSCSKTRAVCCRWIRKSRLHWWGLWYMRKPRTWALGHVITILDE